MLLIDFLFCIQPVAHVSNEKENKEFLDNFPIVIDSVNDGKREEKEKLERPSLPDERLERKRRIWIVQSVQILPDAFFTKL